MGRVAAILGTAVALAFFGVVFWRSAGALPPLDLGSGLVWRGLIGGLALYILSQLTGAAAWRAALAIYNVHLPALRAESQLLLSQIGKYIPGNVAHLIGRFALARTDGIEAAVAGAAMVLEVGFLLAVGISMVGVLVLVAPELVTALTAELPDWAFGWGAGLGVCGLLAGLFAGPWLIWRRAGRPKLTLSRMVLPVMLHGGNFILLGISLWCVALAVHPDGTAGLIQCTIIFITAWVAGFLMPGAPGGVGVRDGIIALGLELFIGPGAGLSVAVAHRAISVLGDIATFGIGLMLRRG